MAESLPQELVDAIIDEVHDFNDLKACSLISHAFSSRTRAILFREVRLSGRSQLGAFQRFFELCIISPHIPSFVQTLCIHGYHRGPTLLRPTPDTVNAILQFMQSQNHQILRRHHQRFVRWIPGTALIPPFPGDTSL